MEKKMEEKLFKRSEVQKLLGVNCVTLQDWRDRGFIPYTSGGGSSGYNILWSKLDLCKIRLFIYLIKELKISRTIAGRMIGFLRDWKLDYEILQFSMSDKGQPCSAEAVTEEIQFADNIKSILILHTRRILKDLLEKLEKE